MTSSRRASKRLSSEVASSGLDGNDLYSPADGFQYRPGPGIDDSQHLQPPVSNATSSVEPAQGSSEKSDMDKKSKEGRYSFTLGNDGSNSRMAQPMFAGAGTGLGVSMDDSEYQGQVMPPMINESNLPTITTTAPSEIELVTQQRAVAPPATSSAAASSSASGSSSAAAISKAAEAAAESQRNQQPQQNSQDSDPRQPHRAYLGPTGPSQPYGMYPQNTVPEEDPHLPLHEINHAIPVGFSGREQTFHRRLGPEGEEAQDSITADGYREPLPAYSERDDTATLKRAPPAANASVTTVTSTVNVPQPAVLPPVDPNANSDLYESGATLQSQNTARPATAGTVAPALGPGSPSEASMTSERSGSPGSVADDSSQILLNSSTGIEDEKAERKERRACGLPLLWVLIGVAIILVLFIGALAGSLARKGHGQPPRAPVASDRTGTRTYIHYLPTPTDIAPLPTTPTAVPPLELGNWALPLDRARSVERSCLSSGSDFNAWSCTFAGDPFFELNITKPEDNPDRAYLELGSARPKTGYPRYGAQPVHFIDTNPLQLIQDLNDQGRGPAYFFSTVINKTVILRKQDFNPPQRAPDNLRRRQLAVTSVSSHSVPLPTQGAGNSNSLYGHVTRKEAKVGEELWICTWENTLLEGFYYPLQNSTGMSYGAVDPNLPSPTTSDAAEATGTAAVDPNDTASAASPAFTMAHPPPPLGKIFKLTETREPVRGGKPPYCKLMSVAGTGRLADVTDPDSGRPIQFILAEPDVAPLQASPNAASSAKRKGVVDNATIKIKKRGGSSACRCEWMNF